MDPDEFASMVHGLAQRSHRLFADPTGPVRAAAATAATGLEASAAGGRMRPDVEAAVRRWEPPPNTNQRELRGRAPPGPHRKVLASGPQQPSVRCGGAAPLP